MLLAEEGSKSSTLKGKTDMDYGYESTKKGDKTLFRVFGKGSRRKTIALCGNEEKAILVVKGLNSSLEGFQVRKLLDEPRGGDDQ